MEANDNDGLKKELKIKKKKIHVNKNTRE